MKTVVKGVIINEKGYILIAVLILLVVGGLILTPLLGLMSTGLLAGKVYEKKMDEYYAADAGVEDAIWKITHNESISYPYYYPEPLTVNDKIVDVVINRTKEYSYRILSIAATDDGGGTAGIDSGTQIEAYLTGRSDSILNHILCSQLEIDDDKCGVVLNYTDEHAPVSNYTGYWPTPQELHDFYWPLVSNQVSYNETIDLGGANITLQSGYRIGDLSIQNKGNQPQDWTPTLTLNGTLYISGDTIIKPEHWMTLNLNGNTVFVNSTTPQWALNIGAGGGSDDPKLKLRGPGALIAVGGIYFNPGEQLGGNESPIFVWSVNGTSQLHPKGAFYGAVAGRVEVDVDSNVHVTYPTGGFGNLTIPSSIWQVFYTIASWEISGV